MIESAADRALMFDAAAFAEAATWTPAAGAPVAVSGIYTDGHAAALGAPGVSGSAPAFSCAADTVPGIAHGDSLFVRAASWRVADVQPDGSGLTRLILERF